MGPMRPIFHFENKNLIEKFERLRPYPIIHRRFAVVFHFSPVKKFTRVRLTSTDFAIVPDSDFIQRPISFDLYPRKKLAKFHLFRRFCGFEVGQLLFKIFSSILLSSRRRQIRCQSSIKFDRLRPFLVIHRVLTTIFPFLGVFEFDRVRRSSTDFDSHCSSQAIGGC